MSEASVSDPAQARLDHWLDVACLFKTRSEAQRAIRAGHVAVGGVSAKAHRLLKLGERVEIERGSTRQLVVVRGFAERHVAKALARQLYEDLTPPPSPAELEARRVARLLRQAAPPPRTTPGARDRRLLRRLRGKG